MNPEQPLVVSLGGGVNSTAMLIEFDRRGIRPDAIIFADTGGEHPHTYRHVWDLNTWLIRHYMPGVTVVHNEGKYRTLEARCLRDARLPSLVYGFKQCSQRFKIEPIKKWVRHTEWWKEGWRITQAIGIDAGEAHRAARAPIDDPRFDYWHPLVEWDIHRDGCERIIASAGLCVPYKSSCFFCPAMKKKDIRFLYQNYPELAERALAIERAGAAYNEKVKGLGRHFSWADFIEWDKGVVEDDKKQTGFAFPDPPDAPCMCDT